MAHRRVITDIIRHKITNLPTTKPTIQQPHTNIVTSITITLTIKDSLIRQTMTRISQVRHPRITLDMQVGCIQETHRTRCTTRLTRSWVSPDNTSRCTVTPLHITQTGCNTRKALSDLNTRPITWMQNMGHRKEHQTKHTAKDIHITIMLTNTTTITNIII
jgi:hypothetical protein